MIVSMFILNQFSLFHRLIITIHDIQIRLRGSPSPLQQQVPKLRGGLRPTRRTVRGWFFAKGSTKTQPRVPAASRLTGEGYVSNAGGYSKIRFVGNIKRLFFKHYLWIAEVQETSPEALCWFFLDHSVPLLFRQYKYLANFREEWKVFFTSY